MKKKADGREGKLKISAMSIETYHQKIMQRSCFAVMNAMQTRDLLYRYCELLPDMEGEPSSPASRASLVSSPVVSLETKREQLVHLQRYGADFLSRIADISAAMDLVDGQAEMFASDYREAEGCLGRAPVKQMVDMMKGSHELHRWSEFAALLSTLEINLAVGSQSNVGPREG